MWKLPPIILLINWFLSCSHFFLKGRRELDWEGILPYYPLLDPDLKYLRPRGGDGRWGRVVMDWKREKSGNSSCIILWAKKWNVVKFNTMNKFIERFFWIGEKSSVECNKIDDYILFVTRTRDSLKLLSNNRALFIKINVGQGRQDSHL